MSSEKIKRIVAYIDGFNLYFGMRSKEWQKYYWLDVQKMCKKLLKSDQSLVFTKYFTAHVTAPPDKKERQDAYLDALETLSEFEIFFGRFQLDNFECPKCKRTYKIPHEKKTDVNIAAELIFDAFEDNFDIAMIISADSDLTSPITKIKGHFPDKRILIVFPPDRFSFELTDLGIPVVKTIRKSVLKNSQFPDEIVLSSGYKIIRPTQWR